MARSGFISEIASPASDLWRARNDLSIQGHALSRGFTLLELLVVVALLAFISASMVFAMQGALESWSYTKDQLSLQKVLSETMNMMMNGSVERYGLKDSLQIMEASAEGVAFVPPWMDESHRAATEDIVYTLNRPLKPGAATPIGQVKLESSSEWHVVPVKRVELEGEKRTQVRLGVVPPESADLRFIFHPDANRTRDAVQRIYWDEDEHAIYLNTGNDTEMISKNPFGVRFDQVQFFYFTTGNVPVGMEGGVPDSQLPVITGVEVGLEASVGSVKQTLVNFVSFRNAPLRTGYLTLAPEMEVPIPDSKKIHTLQLTNFMGIRDGDTLELVARPRHGSSWGIKLVFEKIGSNPWRIKTYTVEYPSGSPILVQLPTAQSGAPDTNFDLLIAGGNGLYDYDDDLEIEDVVKLEGDVTLEVKEMTLEGAGLFVRP